MKKFINELIPYIVIVIVVVLIRSFIITPGIVKGRSMEDTLHDKDMVIVNKIALRKGINRFDIVVINNNEGTLIKRVIGLPNETVEYKNNVLYVDGKQIISEFSFEETEDFILSAGEEEYIVLGDNRDVSKDSRIIGAIKKEDIKGKVSIRLYPFKEIGFVR